MDSKVSRKKFVLEEPPPHDPYLHWRVRRNTLYAFIGSLIVHALVLFVIPQQRVGSGEPSESTRNSLVVKLRPPAAQSAQSTPAVIPETQPASAAERRPRSSAAPVIALKSPSNKLSRPVEPVIPAGPPSQVPAAPTDMQSFVDAARARRRAAEGLSGRDQAAAAAPAAEREPSEDEIRMANVKRNLTVGTSGIFQIITIESRRAAFSFRGWTNDSSNARREYVQVEIGTSSSIEIAIVRRMIELIRKYYKGDFNWESQRLDRTVVLSARIEDNEGLEAFMLKEFFGEPPRNNRFR